LLRTIIFEEKEKPKKKKKNATFFWERRNEDKLFGKKILPDNWRETQTEK
jgi:hypothetical protein